MHFKVSEADAGKRLDQFCALAIPGLSRKKTAALIEAGKVLVNGRKARKGDPVDAGQIIEVEAFPVCAYATPDDACPVTILLEDEHILAVDKPAGRHSAPLKTSDRGTLAQALVAKFPEIAEVGPPLTPGIAHRLDYWTSGILLAAKTRKSYDLLRGAFRDHKLRKEYCAVCVGDPPQNFRVDEPISHPSRRSDRVIVQGAKGRGAAQAQTEFITETQRERYALVRAKCATGAMHQVRAHLAYAGYPLAGDVLYGGPPLPEARFFLHAAAIAFSHPASGEMIEIQCDPPDDFKAKAASLSLMD